MCGCVELEAAEVYAPSMAHLLPLRARPCPRTSCTGSAPLRPHGPGVRVLLLWYGGGGGGASAPFNNSAPPKGTGGGSQSPPTPPLSRPPPPPRKKTWAKMVSATWRSFCRIHFVDTPPLPFACPRLC